MSRLLLWVGLAAIVQAQTLELVLPFQSGPFDDSRTVLESFTDSVSALGVGSDGMTTYLRVGAETLAIEISGGVTTTLFSGTIPYTATFVEDASNFRMGATDSDLSEFCTFGADGVGTCVEQFVSQVPGGVSTLTSTYSGSVEPWYTLNAAAAVVTSAPSGFSTSTSPTSRPASQIGTSSGSSPTASAPNSAASPWKCGSWMAIAFPILLHFLY
ncbi:hypothetical protein B0H12DRAFT_1150732 [Mycena haematopus]|nr:hypothetical protein B0H12DRAFT_1150732 [Mycena haematopus]